MSAKPIILAVGEVLWDLLPGGKQMGGAPGNFAYHAGRLGGEARIVSAVGADELGRELLEQLRGRGVDTSLVAVDRGHPTGTVTVAVDGAGQPTYTIHEGVAWDYLGATPAVMEAAGRADCVCFGTLAQRSAVSRGAIREVVARAPDGAVRILDVNFRQDYYDREVVEESLGAATVLKINDAEWPRLVELLGGGGDLFGRFSRLRVVAVTRGSKGASLWGREGERSDHPGRSAGTVVDTVGAGDAFTSVLAVGLLRGWPLARINERANRLAAFVCTRAGGMPEIPGELLGELGLGE